MPKRCSFARALRRGVRLLLMVAALALLPACRSEAPEPVSEPETPNGEYEGLSREEIERRATSMTPAEAERLGIVDTTIHTEAPIGPDSILPGGFGAGGVSTTEVADEP